MKINKTLTKCDTFGAEVKFNLNGKMYHQSGFGGCMTLFIFALLTMVCVRGSLNLLNKETFTIQSLQTVYIDPELINISKENFMFAVKMDYQTTDKKKIFDFKFQQVTYLTDLQGNRTTQTSEIQMMEQCTSSHFDLIDKTSSQNNISQIIILSQISNYYCLPQNFQANISGTYNSQIFSFAKIMIDICSDSQCYNSQQITELINNGSIPSSYQVTTLISNTQPQIQTEQQTVKYLYQDFLLYSHFDNKINKVNIFLEKQHISIDNSVFPGYTDLNQQILLKVQDQKLNIFTTPANQLNQQVHFYIRLSQTETNYNKSYYRFDQFLSYIGGMSKFFLSFIGFFILQYNQTGLQIKLANYLYQFDLPVQKEGRVVYQIQNLVTSVMDQVKQIDEMAKKFKQSAQRIMSINKLTHVFRPGIKMPHSVSFGAHAPSLKPQSSSIKMMATQREHIHEEHDEDSKSLSQHPTLNLDQAKQTFLDQIIDHIVCSKNRVQFGITYILHQVFKCCNCCKKDPHKFYTQQLVSQSQQMIQTDLDILVIMDKLQEIGKMKHVLLDREQRKIFNCLPKPIVTLSSHLITQTSNCSTPQPNHIVVGLDKKGKTYFNKRMTLFGGRNRFETKKQLANLYKAYEEIKINTKNKRSEKNQFERDVINERLIELLEPTLQHSFSSLGKLQELAEQNKKKQTTRFKSFQTSPQFGLENDENYPEHYEESDQKELNSQKDHVRLDTNIKTSQVDSKRRMIEFLSPKSNFVESGLDSD